MKKIFQKNLKKAFVLAGMMGCMISLQSGHMMASNDPIPQTSADISADMFLKALDSTPLIHINSVTRQRMCQAVKDYAENPTTSRPMFVIPGEDQALLYSMTMVSDSSGKLYELYFEEKDHLDSWALTLHQNQDGTMSWLYGKDDDIAYERDSEGWVNCFPESWRHDYKDKAFCPG